MNTEKKELENSENSTEPQKEEPTEDQTSQKGTEDQTSEKGDETYTEREKQLYERVKKAEAKAKMLEHVEKKTKEADKGSEVPVADVAKTVHALKDFSPEEVDTIFQQAKVLGIDPIQAKDNEDVLLLIQAKREKVAKQNKTPEPTNRQSTEGKDFSDWKSEDLENASIEQIEKFRDWLKNR